MDTNNRLKQVRESLRLSQKHFSEQLGVKQSYYSEVENSKRPVGNKIISSLLDKFKISSDWMLTGKGDVNITNSEQNMTGSYDGFDDGFKQTDMHGNNTRNDARFKENSDHTPDSKISEQTADQEMIEHQIKKAIMQDGFLPKKSHGLQRRIEKQLKLKIAQSSVEISEMAFLIDRLNDFAFILDDLKSYYFDKPEEVALNREKYYNGSIFDYDSYADSVVSEYEKLLKFKPSIEKLVSALFIFYKDIESLDEHDISATLYGISERSKVNENLKRK